MGTNNSRPVDDAVDRDKLCQYDEFDDGEVCGAPLADYSANYRQDIACRRHADLVCKWCKEAFSLRKEFGRGIDYVRIAMRNTMRIWKERKSRIARACEWIGVIL